MSEIEYFKKLHEKIGDDFLTLSSLNIMKTSNYEYPNHFVSLWDDFTHNIPSWENYLFDKFKGKDDLVFLELGTAQARASVWLLEEVLTGNGCKLLTVDHKTEQYASIKGNSFLAELYNTIDKQTPNVYPDKIMEFKNRDWWKDRNDFKFPYNVLRNLKPYQDSERCDFFKGTTSTFFKSLNVKEEVFDFIYIDASHNPEDVILDAVNSFRLLKTGGMMIFDDYGWGNCKVGIDCFLETHRNYLEHHLDKFTNYQMIVEKTKDLV